MARAGSYCKGFANYLLPDRIGCIMMLHYDGGLSQSERDKLRDNLCRNRPNATIYIGRMHFLQKSSPKNLPPEARVIYTHIKANTVIVFGPPCCGWWSHMLHTIKDLDLYQKGKLSVDQFFAGYNNLATDIFEYMDAAICPDPGHPYVGLDYLGYPDAWLDYISPPQPEYQDIHMGPPAPDYQAVSHESSVLPDHTIFTLIGLLEGQVATPLPVEDKDRMIIRVHNTFYAKLRATIMGSWQQSYSCISFEMVRALYLLSSRGLSTFVNGSIDVVFREMAVELLDAILSLESAKMMEILADLWDGGFIDRCKTFLSLASPNFVKRIGMVFKDGIILSTELEFSRRLLDLVLHNTSGHQPLLRRVTQMLFALGEDVYLDVFEKPFFEKLSNLTLEEFYTIINDDDDLDSWSSYLVNESSRLKLVTILREVVLANESDWVVLYLLKGSTNQGMTSNFVRVGTLYKTLSRSAVGSLIFFPWVQGCFDRCMSTFPQDPSCTADHLHLIEEIITAARNCKLTVESYLDQNLALFQHVDACIGNLLNGCERYAEYISLFADSKLREGPEGVAALNDVVALIDLLKNKDTFEAYYLKHLAKRIVYGQAGLEAESLVISKLEAVMSTVHANSMIVHALKSAEVMQVFEMTSASHVPSLSVHVFDPISWPLSAQTCHPPAQAIQEAEKFESDYRSATGKSESRVLKWLADCGSAVIEGRFAGGTHEIEVTTREMCVLVQFNSSDCLTLEDIQKATGLALEDLKETLNSLWKRSLLLSALRDGLQCFSINEDYHPQSGRLCDAHTQSARESNLEFVVTLSNVQANRKYPIEAAVVRLMKANKRMQHSELVEAVVEALKRYFEADVGQIKDRIESLIEREYVERDSNDPEFYLYLE